jgi:hypothetical protein
MKGLPWRYGVLGLLFSSGVLFASTPRSEKALWIEINEKGGKRTIIAVTEGIARELLNSMHTKVNFSREESRDLITKEMVQSVLDGDQESVEARDENGSRATLYMKALDMPRRRDGSGRLVLETFKSGKKIFHFSLPEIEIESHDEESDDFVSVSLGWKCLLPFLAKAGGAIYVEADDDETEVWIYVD